VTLSTAERLESGVLGSEPSRRPVLVSADSPGLPVPATLGPRAMPCSLGRRALGVSVNRRGGLSCSIKSVWAGSLAGP